MGTIYFSFIRNVFFTLFFFLFPQIIFSQEVTKTIIVADSETKEPLSGIQVAIYDTLSMELVLSDSTDEEGKIVFSFLITSTDDEVKPPNGITLSNVYPNPVEERSSMDIEIPINDELFIEIFNVIGQRVASYNSQVQPGIYQMNFIMGGLSSGVYFSRVTIDGKSKAQKFTYLGNSGVISQITSLQSKSSLQTIDQSFSKSALNDPSSFEVFLSGGGYREKSDFITVSDQEQTIYIERYPAPTLTLAEGYGPFEGEQGEGIEAGVSVESEERIKYFEVYDSRGELLEQLPGSDANDGEFRFLFYLIEEYGIGENVLEISVIAITESDRASKPLVIPVTIFGGDGGSGGGASSDSVLAVADGFGPFEGNPGDQIEFGVLVTSDQTIQTVDVTNSRGELLEQLPGSDINENGVIRFLVTLLDEYGTGENILEISVSAVYDNGESSEPLVIPVTIFEEDTGGNHGGASSDSVLAVADGFGPFEGNPGDQIELGVLVTSDQTIQTVDVTDSRGELLEQLPGSDIDENGIIRFLVTLLDEYGTGENIFEITVTATFDNGESSEPLVIPVTILGGVVNSDSLRVTLVNPQNEPIVGISRENIEIQLAITQPDSFQVLGVYDQNSRLIVNFLDGDIDDSGLISFTVNLSESYGFGEGALVLKIYVVTNSFTGYITEFPITINRSREDYLANVKTFNNLDTLSNGKVISHYGDFNNFEFLMLFNSQDSLKPEAQINLSDSLTMSYLFESDSIRLVSIYNHVIDSLIEFYSVSIIEDNRFLIGEYSSLYTEPALKNVFELGSDSLINDVTISSQIVSTFRLSSMETENLGDKQEKEFEKKFKELSTEISHLAFGAWGALTHTVCNFADFTYKLCNFKVPSIDLSVSVNSDPQKVPEPVDAAPEELIVQKEEQIDDSSYILDNVTSTVSDIVKTIGKAFETCDDFWELKKPGIIFSYDYNATFLISISMPEDVEYSGGNVIDGYTSLSLSDYIGKESKFRFIKTEDRDCQTTISKFIDEPEWTIDIERLDEWTTFDKEESKVITVKYELPGSNSIIYPRNKNVEWYICKGGRGLGCNEFTDISNYVDYGNVDLQSDGTASIKFTENLEDNESYALIVLVERKTSEDSPQEIIAMAGIYTYDWFNINTDAEINKDFNIAYGSGSSGMRKYQVREMDGDTLQNYTVDVEISSFAPDYLNTTRSLTTDSQGFILVPFECPDEPSDLTISFNESRNNFFDTISCDVELRNSLAASDSLAFDIIFPSGTASFPIGSSYEYRSIDLPKFGQFESQEPLIGTISWSFIDGANLGFQDPGSFFRDNLIEIDGNIDSSNGELPIKWIGTRADFSRVFNLSLKY